MNGNHTMKYSEACGSDPVPESPFRSLAGAVELLADARARLAKITDTIVGLEPPQPAAMEKDRVGHCLLDEVENAASAIRSIANRMFEDINRIERRL